MHALFSRARSLSVLPLLPQKQDNRSCPKRLFAMIDDRIGLRILHSPGICPWSWKIFCCLRLSAIMARGMCTRCRIRAHESPETSYISPLGKKITNARRSSSRDYRYQRLPFPIDWSRKTPTPAWRLLWSGYFFFIPSYTLLRRLGEFLLLIDKDGTKRVLLCGCFIAPIANSRKKKRRRNAKYTAEKMI